MHKPGSVAVIVVHGIADQQPGQTVRELARLLCHGGDGPPRFVQGEVQEVLIPVARLEPGRSTPTASPSSAASEAARRKPGTPSGFYQAHEPVEAEGRDAERVAGSQSPQDLGLELNDYLLGRLELSEADALYTSARITLRRRQDHQPVDIYEMYWADLSRLGSGGLQALASLYQLFFHLSTLAADCVDQVSLCMQGGRAWQLLQRLHAWMAWLMKAPAALVQLAMLLVVLFGATALVPDAQQGLLLAVLYGTGSIVLLMLAALAWLQRGTGLAGVCKPLVLLLGALASATAAVGVIVTEQWLAWYYLASAALAAALGGAWLVERYARVTKGVRVPGHVLVLTTLVLLGLRAWLDLPYVTTLPEWMFTTGLHVAELLFVLMLLVWATFFIVQTIALLLGLWLGRTGSVEVRMSLHTARLCLVLSTGLFAILSLVLWSVLSYGVGFALNDIGYAPLVFGDGYWASAAAFLDAQMRGLGTFFTPLVVAAALVGIAVLLVLGPSLLEELTPDVNIDSRGIRSGAVQRSLRLGCWLDTGMRRLDAVMRIAIPLGALVGALLFLAFVFQKFALSSGELDRFALWLARWLELFQGEALVAAGKWMAAGAIAIIALGAHFTQTFGRLRVVIDAVLDVDNYFGDPPNRQPPRARIFSRYAALLCYLRERGYERLVIVSHSQGTVISAELLRYLHAQQRLEACVGALPVALVTAGSPLRDLYARRFPLLYRWMGGNPLQFAGAAPAAADIGACEWVNVCRSGDYVGRYIWTPPGGVARHGIAGCDTAGRVQAQRSGDCSEFCLGAGGHTHYFSNDALALAAEIDRLITTTQTENRNENVEPVTPLVARPAGVGL